MAKDIWGPAGWKFIHYITLAYPDNPTASEQRDYKTFFQALGKVIPCPTCQVNYQEHMRELPLNDVSLASKDSMIEWGVAMHNAANKATGKRTWTVEEAMNELAKEYREWTVDAGWTGREWAVVLIGLGIIIWSIGGIKG